MRLSGNDDGVVGYVLISGFLKLWSFNSKIIKPVCDLQASTLSSTTFQTFRSTSKQQPSFIPTSSISL